VESGYELVAAAMTLMGLGLALAMAPATEAIMGSLPAAKAGIGSAVNDVVREVGGTLGVAVLGSVLASAYAPGMDGATGGLAPEAADVAADSVGGAHHVASQLGGEAATRLVSAADHAFVDAMATTTSIAATVALAGALVALAFLPARERRSHVHTDRAMTGHTAAAEA
jgi:MFS transporter, DHA2 family, multidrug resistance protein